MELNGLPPALLALREAAKTVRDPTCADETLAYLLSLCGERSPARILEIGTAEGLTACAMLTVCGARYTGIELDPARAAKARENFIRFAFSDRVTLFEGDAGEILPLLQGGYDLIFADGPKVQYLRYLPDCKRLLKRGGVLLSDDVFFLGKEMEAVPKKRRMLALHLAEYRQQLQNDPVFETKFYDYGEGVAVSIKR